MGCCAGGLAQGLPMSAPPMRTWVHRELLRLPSAEGRGALFLNCIDLPLVAFEGPALVRETHPLGQLSRFILRAIQELDQPTISDLVAFLQLTRPSVESLLGALGRARLIKHDSAGRLSTTGEVSEGDSTCLTHERRLLLLWSSRYGMLLPIHPPLRQRDLTRLDLHVSDAVRLDYETLRAAVAGNPVEREAIGVRSSLIALPASDITDARSAGDCEMLAARVQLDLRIVVVVRREANGLWRPTTRFWSRLTGQWRCGGALAGTAPVARFFDGAADQLAGVFAGEDPGQLIREGGSWDLAGENSPGRCLVVGPRPRGTELRRLVSSTGELIVGPR